MKGKVKGVITFTISFVSWLWSVGLSAQTPPAPTLSPEALRSTRKQNDSLFTLLRSGADDRTKLRAYETLAANLNMLSRLDSAIVLSDSAYRLALRTQDSSAIFRSLMNLGTAYGNSGSRDYTKSLQYYEMAAAVASRMYAERHNAYSSILNIHFYSGNFPEATAIVAKGLSLAEERRDIPRTAQYHSLFGFIYLRQRNYAEAEKSYSRYLSLAKANLDSITVADAYNCMGEVCSLTGNFPGSLQYHLHAWKLYSERYNAGVFFKHDQMANTAFRISHVYKMMSRYDEARKFSGRVFEFTKKHGTNEYDMVNYLLNASQIYRHTGDYDMSLAGAWRALRLSQAIKHRENIRDSYKLLADIYRQSRRFDSAYHYQVLYSALNDSIVNEQTRNEVQHIITTHSLEAKDREIRTLQQEKQLIEAETDRQRLLQNALITFIALLAIVLWLLYNRYRLRQENKFQMALNVQQNKMFNALAIVQDQERKRIAQDLHDTLGSALSTAKLRMSAMEEYSASMHPKAREHVQTVMTLLDEAVIDLRNISHDIMPATLSKLGLVAALQNLFDRISSGSGIQFHYSVHGLNGRLEETSEIVIYRIILESVNNAVKHAGPANITVQLVRYTDHINVIVEDDGSGFDLDEVMRRSPGAGLKNIISRVQSIKGKIEIDTSPGQGTSIAMDIPAVMEDKH